MIKPIWLYAVTVALYFAITPWAIAQYSGALPVLVNGSGLERFVTVAKSGGDFTRVDDAVSSVVDATARKPAVILIAPGIYEVRESLRIPPYIHLSGAGANVTRIFGSLGSTQKRDVQDAIVIAGGHTMIRDLSIINRSTGNYASALRYAKCELDDPQDVIAIQNVVIKVSGNADHKTGMHLHCSKLDIQNLNVSINGGSSATGIDVGGGGVKIEDAVVSVSYASVNTGIRIRGVVDVDGAQIRVGSGRANPDSYNYGVFLDYGNVDLTRMKIQTRNGNNSFGIKSSSRPAIFSQFRLSNSQIAAGHAVNTSQGVSLLNIFSSSIRSSRIEGRTGSLEVSRGDTEFDLPVITSSILVGGDPNIAEGMCLSTIAMPFDSVPSTLSPDCKLP